MLIMVMVIRALKICAVTGVLDFMCSRDKKLAGETSRKNIKWSNPTPGRDPRVRQQNRIFR